MRIHLFTILVLVVFYSCTTSGSIADSSFYEKETEIIKQLELKAISAEFRLDTAAIASVMHDKFIAVYPNKLQDKQQEISGIYNGMVKRKKEGETMDSIYLDDFRAQFHNNNNTAIVTFFTVTKGQRKGVSYKNQRWRWYDVWVKEKGTWKLVSIQGTPVM